MSGHSKWATIKHQKGAKDKVRAKVFAKVLRQVEVAAREGGADMTANATLRTMYQKAREASVPTDTIERAIKRGTGDLEGVRYVAVNYEGYAPMGVAVYVETLTDNRNRTGADVRAIFSKNGGSSAEPGAVAWQFERKAVLIVDKTGPSGRGSGGPGPSGRGSGDPGPAADEDELMMIALEAGAEDLEDQGDTWQLTAPPTDLGRLRDALEAAGVKVTSAELTMVPTSTIALESEADARKVLRVVDALEDHDDVQAVYANFDIPDSVLQLVEAGA
jgi:YebC/PmpR family DNA-binding regulatory protein